MRAFSNDIVTPEVLQTSIAAAFEAQNVIFENMIEYQHEKIRRLQTVSIILNLVVFGMLSIIILQ